ncbi:MAG: hypothetical protein E7469_00945 [Ruminococcaceae bacterium]|nr:hypothetical protein [Oscillospiraceae bacterium]
MNKLFWGFFFLFLNFSVNMDASSLQLLPDWVGFILLYAACNELESESELFQKPRPFCVGLAVYTGILWLMDLLGIGANLGILSWVLGLTATCLNLYVSMLIIDAITNMEMRRNYDLCSAYLRRVWKVVAVATIAANVLLIVPVVAVVCALVAAVAGIVFLVAIHKTRKAYQQMLIDQSKPF